MRKITLFLSALLMCILTSNATQPEDLAWEKGATKLFNGKNLDNWYTYIADRGKNSDPKGVFTVKDGVIHISGEEWGCITTDKEYNNYKITIRYKWGEKTWATRVNSARDSGLLFHCVGADGNTSNCWTTSIECNIIEGRTGDFIVIGEGSDDFAITCKVATDENGKQSAKFDPNGTPRTVAADGRIEWVNVDKNWKDEKGFYGKNDVEKPHGEWNVLECVIVSDEVYTFLNGEFINHATEVRPTKGKIQIQSEGAELFISDIVIKEY